LYPEIISFGLPFLDNPVTIYTYGFMIAIGLLIATYITAIRAKKYNIKKEVIFDSVFYIILSGIIGARLLFVFQNFSYYLSSPIEIFYLHQGGLVFYGAFLGGFAALIIYTKIKKIDLLNYSDLIIPQLALAHSFGRLGCFSYGCCYGKIIDNNFLSVCFPKDSPAYINHLNNFLINNNAVQSLPVIPTQLIESAFLLSVFFLLLFLSTKVNRKGYLTAYYFMLYPLFRFVIEFFRGDDRGSIVLNMFSISQFISLLVFIAGLNMFFVLKKKRIQGK
jgi:phosphatidylglycerol---prolipoprotein diacylglyceryl transferase